MKLKSLFLCTFFLSGIAHAEDKVVKLATLNWEPYIGQDLKNKGLFALILEAAFKEEGYKVELSFTPWARAVNEAKNGLLDGLMPEYYDSAPDGRLKDFVFSNSFFKGPVGFLTLKSKNIKYNKNDDLNKTYDELKQYKFGVVRDYINEEKFDARIYEFNKGKADGTKNLAAEVANSDEININKLKADRIDIIFIDKYVAEYFIDKNFKNDKNKFIFLEPALALNDLYIAFSKKAKDSEAKMNAFNNGMKKIKENGILKKLIKNDIYFSSSVKN